MQKEIDHLKRSLRHEQRQRAPSHSDFSSDAEEDYSYKRRSRTPPRESSSYDEGCHPKHKNRISSSGGLGNDTMSKALNQIFKSPFTHWIEEGRLPWQFTQPSFTMYNRTCQPLQSKNGCALQERTLDVQGIPIKLRARDDEMV